MDSSRDLFLSEFIINYLQTTYPEIYSDISIIHKYIEYKHLKDLEFENELTEKNKERLEELNVYFFGSSNGDLNGDAGYNLINMYKNTIDIIEKLIDTNDTAVQDVVSELVNLIQINIHDDDALKKYINELILPSIFKENIPNVPESRVKGTIEELPKTIYEFKTKPIKTPDIEKKSEILSREKQKQEQEKVERKKEMEKIIRKREETAKTNPGLFNNLLGNIANTLTGKEKDDEKKKKKVDEKKKKKEEDEEEDEEEHNEKKKKKEEDEEEHNEEEDDSNIRIISSNSIDESIDEKIDDIIMKDLNSDDFFDINVVDNLQSNESEDERRRHDGRESDDGRREDNDSNHVTKRSHLITPEQQFLVSSNDLIQEYTKTKQPDKLDIYKSSFNDAEIKGGQNNINDFDEIYDKVKDLKLVKKINNKKLIYLLLNTHSLCSLITKNKSEKILKQYVNSILLTIIETIKKTIRIFIKYDLLLSSYFDLREIIFYNLLNYLYSYYGYIIDDKIFGNIIEILNDNYNYHLKKNNNYLLLFVYKYSKLQDISKLLGYDSFKTYMTINSIGKLNDKIKLNNVSYDISDSKSLSLYDFIDLKREFNIHLTDIQLKQCIKELNKFSTENKKGYFVINSKIIDKICIYSNNIFKKKYNNLPIINFDNYLEKDIVITKSFNDITYSILYLSSFLFRNEKEISSKIYCELVRNYIEIEKSKTLLKSIAYQMIYMMYKRVNKNKLLEKLQRIKTIEEPHLFIKPKIIKIEKFNEIIVKFLIDFYNYCEAKHLYNSFYDIFVPFLSFYYYYDNNNKLQIMAQELLCNKKNKHLLGGGYDDDDDDENDNNENDEDDDSFTQEKIEMIKKKCDEIKRKIENFDENEQSLKDKITKIFKFEIDNNTYDADNYEDKIDDYIQKNNTNDKLNRLLVAINIKLNSIKKIININTDKEFIDNNYEIEITDDFKKFIKAINDQDLKEYDSPSLLRIQNLNRSKPIIKSIKDYNNIWKKILKEYSDAIIRFYTNLEDRIEIINKATDSNKPDDNYDDRYHRRRGGSNLPSNLETKINDLKEKLKEKGKDINKEIDEIVVDLSRFKTKQFVTANPNRKIISSKIIDKNDYNIFDNLLNSYEADYNNPKIPHQITDNLFYTKVKANNLDPAEELKITFNDKLMFIGVVYVLRLIASYMTYYMIEMSYSTTLSKSLYYYILCYILVFVITVFIINFDTFFLRIFVNYLNMHINTLGITTHIFLMVVFVYIVYLLIININGIERPKSRLNDTEKIKLKYKMDLLTMIIFVFICLLTFII